MDSYLTLNKKKWVRFSFNHLDTGSESVTGRWTMKPHTLSYLAIVYPRKSWYGSYFPLCDVDIRRCTYFLPLSPMDKALKSVCIFLYLP